MPISLLARNWDYLKRQHGLPDDVVPVDITETARWFFEEDDTDYRDYREDFPCVVSPWPAAWFEFPAPQFYLDSDGRILNGLTVLTDTSPDSRLDAGMVQPVLFALSLLHCKNVSVEDLPPTPAKSRRNVESGICGVGSRPWSSPMRGSPREGRGKGAEVALPSSAHFRVLRTRRVWQHVGRYFWQMRGRESWPG
jgi:hypothetical protein